MRMHRTLFHALLAAALVAASPSPGPGPARAQTLTPAAAPPVVEARVVAGDVPTLQLTVAPLAPGEGRPRPRVIEIVLDSDRLADALLGGETDQLWQDIGTVGGVLQEAGGDRPWFLMRSEAPEPGKARIGIANFDLNAREDESTPVSAAARPLHVVLPLRSGERALTLRVSAGASLDAMSAAATVEAPVERPAEADDEARVRFGADTEPLTALAMGTPVTLSWNITGCVQATLSGPVDYREPSQAIRPDGTVCAGSKRVLALGPATYQLTAEITGRGGSRVNVVIKRTLTLDVRKLDQFANLILTPPSVLPGGTVTARWYIRELPADERREAMLAWTDLHGQRRLQRLRASPGQTVSGEMNFIVPASPGAADAVVRLQYGEETIERAFAIEPWQPAGRSPVASGALRGMAFAGGRLVLCGENGIFLSRVGAGGGIDGNGVGRTNDPFPDFVREPIRVSDRPATEAKAEALPPDAHRIQDAACLAVRAFDAERVVAVIAAGNAEPGTPGYAEMTLIAPAVLSATYPATLTDDPIDTARPQRRDYQIGVLRGRIVVQVQRGPIDRATDLNPRSSIRAFSISESDIRTGRAGWRGEPLLGTPELEPQYGWHMVDGFGNDRQSLFLVNEVTGALSRYDAPINAALLARARDTGSPALLAQAREDIDLDDPKRATDIAPHLAPLLAGGPLVNVGGLLVALGAEVSYNPYTDKWQQGAFGDNARVGSVAAYRGDDEPRLWLVNPDGQRSSLPVDSPRLFSADYFESRQLAAIPYFALGARVTVKSRQPLTLSTDRKTLIEPLSENIESIICSINEKETPISVVVREYRVLYPDRQFDLIGESGDQTINVNKTHFGRAQWDQTVSSDPCVIVRIEPIPVTGN